MTVKEGRARVLLDIILGFQFPPIGVVWGRPLRRSSLCGVLAIPDEVSATCLRVHTEQAGS